MTATYRYSADGVKLEAKVSSGTSNAPAGQPTAYAYLGSLVYSKVGGSYQLESTGFSGGRIVPGDTQYTVRYHITDHLGSVRAVVWPEENSEGAVILEQNDYYPYGLRMDNGLTASTSNRYRFSGKEAQPLMGGDILDFGARYYNPTIARWTTIDPKAEKYYSTTPYSYCAGNPVMYVDPDGNKIRFAKGVSDDFKKSFAATVQYMNKKGTSGGLARLEASPNIYYIDSRKKDSSGFNPVTKTIYWNNSEIVSFNGIWISPATGLDHEVTHALRYDDSLKSDEAREEYKRNNEKGSDPEYGTIEEREVIVNREQATAQKHGEIREDQKTRTGHTGRAVNFDVSNCSPEQIEQAIKDHNLYL